MHCYECLFKGSHICTCIDGFIQNGTFCSDFDECKNGSPDCHEYADCINSQGSYRSVQLMHEGDAVLFCSVVNVKMVTLISLVTVVFVTI